MDRIRIPTRIVWQDVDRLYPRSWADALPAYLADFTLRQVDGVGHFVPVEAPLAFAETVRSAVEAGAC